MVPLIDVSSNWMNISKSTGPSEGEKHPHSYSMDIEENDNKSLHNFLATSKWWASRNVSSLNWNDRCSFVPSNCLEKERTDAPTAKSPDEIKTFGKKDLLKAWSSVMTTPSFLRKDNTLSDDPESLDDESSGSTAVAGVWKRLLDHVADTTYKADLKRLGEERLLADLGEFRHYLVEKVVFNQQNRLIGLPSSSVSRRYTLTSIPVLAKCI